jgi:predicted transglutaminase-like cysteine proteinase
MLLLGLSLAAIFPLLARHALRPYPATTAAFFDTAKIEGVAFLESDSNAFVPDPARAVVRDEHAGAPMFGMDTEPVFGGDLPEKWGRAQAEISQQRKVVALCRDGQRCPAVARELIRLSSEGAGRSGRARVGLINRAVNLAIGPVSDEAQWGVPDHWSAPFETIQSRRGDCEDYAIVKYAALLEAGISADDLKLVVLKNTFPNEDHAVLAVRVNGEWLLLDNRTLTLVRDTDVVRAMPEFMLDDHGVRRFVSANRHRQSVS